MFQALSMTPERSVPGATVLYTVPYFFTLSCSSLRRRSGSSVSTNDFVADAFHLRRRVLAPTLNNHLYTAQLELEDGHHTLMPLLLRRTWTAVAC